MTPVWQGDVERETMRLVRDVEHDDRSFTCDGPASSGYYLIEDEVTILIVFPDTSFQGSPVFHATRGTCGTKAVKHLDGVMLFPVKPFSLADD